MIFLFQCYILRWTMLIFQGVPISLHFLITIQLQNRPFHPSFPVFGRWGSFFSGDRNDIYLRSFRQVWEWVGWLDPVGTSHLEPGPFKWWFFCKRNGNPRKFQGKSRLVKYFFCIIWPDFLGGKKLVLPWNLEGFETLEPHFEHSIFLSNWMALETIS